MLEAIIGSIVTLIIIGIFIYLPKLEKKKKLENRCEGCPHAIHHTCDMTHGYCNRDDDSYNV